MTEFKKGDRVRVINNCGWHNLKLGRTGTIFAAASLGQRSMPTVKWDDIGDGAYLGPLGVLPYRLELILELTDEELAAKYRALRQECNQGWKELKARGYSVGGSTEGGITIYKYVEEEVPVVKIEKVKKEL